LTSADLKAIVEKREAEKAAKEAGKAAKKALPKGQRGTSNTKKVPIPRNSAPGRLLTICP
jgi:hypothetical protein